MKSFLSLLLIASCCLFEINKAQLTSTQIIGTWIDDGTNTGLSANCCPPVATAASPVIFTVGSSSTTMSAAGTWGSATICNTLGIKSTAFASTNNALTSSASANSFPIPFTYTYTFNTGTLTGTTNYAASPATAGVATLAYTMNGASCSQALTTSSTTFVKTDATSWQGQYYVPSGLATTTGCCLPVLGTTAGTDATNNVKITVASGTMTISWTWDTTSTASAAACKLQGLSGLATTTITGVTSSNAAVTLTTTTTTTPVSTAALSSSSAAVWTWAANGQACTFNLKKNSSSASHLVLSFAGLLLFFVAYL